MKTKFLKKLIITSSIVLTVSIGILFACAGGDWEWFGYSNFTPETFVEESYTPLFYAPYEMFYRAGYDDNQVKRFSNEITKDWSVFLENKLNPTLLNYFLLNDSSNAHIEGLFEYISKKNKNASYNQWNAKLNLNDQKIKDFIEFLYFAKEVEASSTTTYDPWDYEKTNTSPKVDASLISQIQKKYQSVTDPFLKNRYWFQTIKAYFYSDSKTESISFFDKTKNDVPKNTLYYRAIAYIAGAYYKNKDYSQSNYFNSIVFDNCPSLRMTIAYNFHPQNENDWQASLNLAKTNEEKAALWALLGYYADVNRAIDEIFRLDPKNKHLDYLITRLVNQEEEKFQIDINQSVTKYKTQLKDKLDKKAIELISTIAQSDKTSNPFLCNMAAAYLQTLNGNYSQARALFAKSENLISYDQNTKELYRLQSLPKLTRILSQARDLNAISEKLLSYDQNAKDHLRLLRLINTLSEMDVMNTKNENLILPELSWLYSQSTDNNASDIRYSAAISWSKRYISAIYGSMNNVIFSELFNRNNGFYRDNEKLNTMKEFLAKTDKTPFEKMAENIYPVSLSDIYEYEAVTATFQNNIEFAFASMQNAKGLNEQLLLGNPFNGFIKDCHDCEHLATQKTKYSKLRFIEIIKIMQEKAAKGEEVYNNNLLLANSFYNISYYGNARYFYNSKLFDADDDYFKTMIFDVSKAKEYYKKALAAATNAEQKAKCNYMLAKCERNEYYNRINPYNSNWDNNVQADFRAWDGFIKLKTQYPTTKFYQDVIAECGYFKTYVSINR